MIPPPINIPQIMIPQPINIPIIDSDFKITIGINTFQIVTLYKYTIYDMIEINNTKETFYCYSSQSSIGVWRLYGRRDKYSVFEKGIDYAQSNLICYELQEYIHKNIDKIPKKDSDEILKYLHLRNDVILSHINDKQRLIK